jgi:hypothetical protein
MGNFVRWIAGVIRSSGWLLLRAVLLAAFGKAALTWLDSLGIHPDAWMLRVMGFAVTTSSLEAMSWLIAAGMALGVAIWWEVADFTQKLRRWTGISDNPSKHDGTPHADMITAADVQSGRFRLVLPPDPIQRDTWFKDAVFYAMNRRWPDDAEKATMFEPDGEITRAASALAELRQAAFDGKLKVWGKPTRKQMTLGGDTSSGIYHEIFPHHWEHHLVNTTEILLEPHQVYTTRAMMIDDESFCALKVSGYQVVDLWRKPAT